MLADSIRYGGTPRVLGVEVGGSAERWTPRVVCVTDCARVLEIRVWRLGDVWYECKSGGRTVVTFSRSERIAVVSSVHSVIRRIRSEAGLPAVKVGFHYPSSRAVNCGSGNRPLVSATPSASDFSVTLIG